MARRAPRFVWPPSSWRWVFTRRMMRARRRGGTTVNPVQNTTYDLGANNPIINPIIFGPQTSIDTHATGNSDAVVGASTTQWTVTNQGSLIGARFGVALGGAGSILANAGTITGGNSGVVFVDVGGTLTNTGTISGNFGVNVDTGTVTNSGTITSSAAAS